jgi:S-formylglutathione hydrolase FrmB
MQILGRFMRVHLAALFLAVAIPCFAASRVECGGVPSVAVHGSVDYCALLPASYDVEKKRTYPVLYMLHGLGDSSRTLITTGIWNLVDDLQAEKKIGEFIIITPEGGRSFYVNSKNGKLRYEDFFIKEFVPAMQQKYRINAARKGRAISGISMGGYGALRFAFKYPQMFSTVAAHMPALLEHMPKGAGKANLAQFMGTSFGQPLDTAFWDSNTPFVFARSANLTGLHVYFDCGDRDDYGFDAGTTALHKLLESRHVSHEYHIYRGGHDWEYVSQHLEASLKFVWREFAEEDGKAAAKSGSKRK